MSYVGCCPGRFERGSFMGRSGLVPYLVVLLVAVSYSCGIMLIQDDVVK